MSNKGPVSLAYQELAELAKKNDVRWGFEGTVMSGTPALRMPLSSLAGNSIFEIRGILNGTTNYILTKMEEGLSYKMHCRRHKLLVMQRQIRLATLRDMMLNIKLPFLLTL